MKYRCSLKQRMSIEVDGIWRNYDQPWISEHQVIDSMIDCIPISEEHKEERNENKEVLKKQKENKQVK